MSSSDPGAASLTALDPHTRALVVLAAAIAVGRDALVEQHCAACVSAGVPPGWVDELMLQSLLMVGWPRTLNATRAWRKASPAPPAGEDGTDYAGADQWRVRGEAVCGVVYGESYRRLRDNVRQLHPALDAWMITEGYGRTLGRPGLDLGRRELCVIAQVSVQGAMRQLHSHLQGALHAGVSVSVITAALDAVHPMLGPEEADLAFGLWKRLAK